MLLTRIPFFREIILMSFQCEHCGLKNSEVQSAGEIQPQGARYISKLENATDLQRQMVKSDTAIIRIEEVDLEIPPGRGRLTNIEGLLLEIKDDLEKDQPLRRAQQPEVYEKIEAIVEKLDKMRNGELFPITITLDDPAGNSSLAPFPHDDAQRFRKETYTRSAQQNATLGLASAERTGASNGENGASVLASTAADGEAINMDDINILEGETYAMPYECPGCSKTAAMNMQMVNIPYFKQVLLTAVVCSHCGYKTSEVKTGGAIPPKGKKIWLEIKNEQDLRRDILKSETCCLTVSECGVEVQPGTMGGRFTTVEGLLTQIRDDLHGSIFDTEDKEGTGGDSMPVDQRQGWERFFAMLDKAIKVEMPYTVLLQDPLANSYVQSLTAPEPDPQLREEEYTRTDQEDEDLGLKDMKTHLNEHGEYVKEEAAA
jgi:zinc finger protein